VKAGILIGYFAKRNVALGVFRELQRRGFRRTALVHKTVDGDIHTWDPFLWRRRLGIILAAIIFGGLAGVASMSPYWPVPVLGRSLSTLISILAGGLIGIFFGGVWIRRSKYGVEQRLLEDHARWLVPEETVLIQQAPVEKLRLPVTLLRDSSEIPPVIFVLHPKRESPVVYVQDTAETLSLEQIQEHVQRLAMDHQVNPKPHRSYKPLEHLIQACQWIHQVCLDLSEASRLEQSMPPTAEWILDNEFLIEGNARDVQLNLPRRYYQQLPALANQTYRGLPRIYCLSKELVSHSDFRLDQKNILAFIKAYQSVHVLTIGELWAIPQMLRAVLIESVQNKAIKALTELREGELADFWANRLFTVNRRDSGQFFAIMAELAQTQSTPSPYFASELINNLSDEEAVLVPVQIWLERTYQLARAKPSDEGSDFHRQRIYQFATTCLIGLETDLRATQPGGGSAWAGSFWHLSQYGFRYAG
jgi:cyclic beta-1,2-glucan synthetase